MSLLTDFKRLQGEAEQFLARHERTKDAIDFTKYADNPEGFFREVLHCLPWARQDEMARRIRDKPVDKTGTLVVTCNGLGKDWITARIALWWVYARGGMVVLTGPTERQVKEILMREVSRAWNARRDLPGELFKMALHVSDDCGILAFTSDDGDKLTGYHHPRLLVCVTEGQGVSEEAYDAARKCCTGAENRLFVYGNPNQPKGPFYAAATSDTWDVLTIPASEHPNVITGREEIPGAVTREWIAQQAREYGETSPVFLSSVLAQFPDATLEGLLQRDWIRAAFDRHERQELHQQAIRSRMVFAVDVARFGPDSSVMARCQGPVVHELTTWRGASITESADKVAAEVDKHTWQKGPYASGKWERAMLPKARPLIVVDEPGLGGGLIDVLKKRGYDVKPFNGAATPREHWKNRFINTRAESHWNLRTLLENGACALPRDKALEEEALAVEYQLAKNEGKVQILSKETLRAELGRSPDRLDAVVMGLYETAGPNNRARLFNYQLGHGGLIIEPYQVGQ